MSDRLPPRRSWAHPDLPRYTWDQAHILGLATAQGFAPLGIAASTIRTWAAAGRVRAVGKAPGGAFLFEIAAVTRLARPITGTEEKR